VRLKLFFSRTEALKGFDSLRAYNNYFFYIRDLVREYASRSHGRSPSRSSTQAGLPGGTGSPPIRPAADPTAGDDRFFFGLVLTTEFARRRLSPCLRRSGSSWPSTTSRK